MLTEMMALWAHKMGNAPEEYEDVAAYREVSSGEGRAIVCDGATEAYDAQRWVRMLATSFIVDAPLMTRATLGQWIADRQGRWGSQPPPRFVSVFDEQKFVTDGSFATLLALTVNVADELAAEATWQAASIGDTVLFHLRDSEPVVIFPPMGPRDFNNTPSLVYTDERRLAGSVENLRLTTGTVLVGDFLIVATDALAHWILARAEQDAPVWRTLLRLDQQGLQQLVEAARSSGEMHNDDVTLLIVACVETPSPLVGDE